MDSSSSEDEANVEALREAVATDFLTDDIFQDSAKDKPVKNTTTEKSLRRNTTNQYSNQLDVTPEFQKYVAKQLVGLLDKKLENKLKTIEGSRRKKQKTVKDGVRLFTSSNSFISLEKNNDITINKRKEKSDDECEEIQMEKIKTVSVEPSHILSKRETVHWSNRSKAPVYRYKQKDGKLELDEELFYK